MASFRDFSISNHGQVDSGHGGGDFGLVRDWVQAISRHDESLLTTTLEASMESHLVGFTAEASRPAGPEPTCSRKETVRPVRT